MYYKNISDMPAASMETKWIANGIHITITFSPLANASATVREILNWFPWPGSSRDQPRVQRGSKYTDT